jgi:hypothetical protein
LLAGQARRRGVTLCHVERKGIRQSASPALGGLGELSPLKTHRPPATATTSPGVDRESSVSGFKTRSHAAREEPRRAFPGGERRFA